MTELLGSNLLLVEADGEEIEVLCAIDEPTASPFCSLLRHGEENGAAAFAGADAACRSCEKRFATAHVSPSRTAPPGKRNRPPTMPVSSPSGPSAPSRNIMATAARRASASRISLGLPAASLLAISPICSTTPL